MTLTRQVPINNTIQVNVGPGDETGLYYILISNLPWQTSWQQLKDHVRTVCSAVERVEIFNESTSGWVCVRGRVNYTAAMHLLGTTPFNGRPMWVDGRNAKEEILIKRLVGAPDTLSCAPRSPRTPRTMPQGTQYPSSTPPLMSPISSDYSQWSPGAPVSIMSTPTTAYGMHPMPMVPVHDYQDSGSWYAAYHSNYVDTLSGMSGSAQQYPSAAAYQYPQTNEYYENEYYSATANTESQELRPPRSRRSHNSTQQVVPTEPRKIIIKKLSKWAQNEQVRGLLRSRCGFSGGEVRNIEVPQSSEGGNRGYAYVTFLSEDYAASAIQKLDKHKYEGKSLDVWYTSEGVSNSEENRPESHRRQHHSSRHGQEDRDKKDEKRDSNKSNAGSSQEKKEKPIKKGVIIANGSSSKADEYSKKSR
ncbi:hypothetical protein AB5N19_06308 [Seiridium cardinale]